MIFKIIKTHRQIHRSNVAKKKKRLYLQSTKAHIILKRVIQKHSSGQRHSNIGRYTNVFQGDRLHKQLIIKHQNQIIMLNDFSMEEPKNASDKLHCILVLDTSGSMYGAPIDELNNGLQRFQEQVLNDGNAADKIEVSIITFGSTVTQIQQPAMLDLFDMPTLEAYGTTPMIEALEQAILLAEDRKTWYKNNGLGYYRPWIILMTDGAPDTPHEVPAMAAKLANLQAQKKFQLTAIGVGDDADMSVLQQLSPMSAKLKGLDFTGFFQWLSASVSMVSQSIPGDDRGVSLPDMDFWATLKF